MTAGPRTAGPVIRESSPMPATPKDNAGGHLLCHSGSYHARAPRLSGASPERATLDKGDRELSQPQSCAQRCHGRHGAPNGNAAPGS